jgi:hypothetical protein
MRELGTKLKEHAPEILSVWEDIIRKEPWSSLAKAHRRDHLHGVVIGLVEASLCDPADVDAHEEKVWAAARHGEERREQGLDEAQILTEYHLLRRAIWQFVRQNISPGKAFEAISRIDTAISLATMASLRGYHRRELEERGDWPQYVERLVGDSPLLRQEAHLHLNAQGN